MPTGVFERTPAELARQTEQMRAMNAEQRPIKLEEMRLRQEMFLTVFGKIFPNIGKTCKESSVPRDTFNGWMKDQGFRKRYQEVCDDCLDTLEQGLYETSKDPKYASLAIAVLKAYRKSTWGEKVEHSGEVSMVSMLNAYRPAVKKEIVES